MYVRSCCCNFRSSCWVHSLRSWCGFAYFFPNSIFCRTMTQVLSWIVGSSGRHRLKVEDRSRCIEASTVFWLSKKKKLSVQQQLQLNCKWNSTTFWVTNFQHNASCQDWKKINNIWKEILLLERILNNYNTKYWC